MESLTCFNSIEMTLIIVAIIFFPISNASTLQNRAISDGLNGWVVRTKFSTQKWATTYMCSVGCRKSQLSTI
jgi:hypothetical protein